MKRPIPRTFPEWDKEIRLAYADAAEAAPFGPMVGVKITPADLFQLAPVVCLKFRGKKQDGRQAERVIQVALANYVAHSDPEEIDNDLKNRPRMAFALCYVAAHLALDLIDEKKGQGILEYFEEHLGDGES